MVFDAEATLVKGGAPQKPQSEFHDQQLNLCNAVGHSAEVGKSLVSTD
jgi:hypothetical protein